MGRHAKSGSVMDKITEVARQLFLAQGYKATTTRQIIEKAGITTGTLYHFFRTKEDILLQIVMEAYTDAMKAVDAIVEKKGDSVLHYMLVYILEMKAVAKYAPIAELYLQSCNSWHITHAMLPLHIKRNKTLFQSYNPEFTDQDYYLRTLALRGMELSFIIEQIHAGKADYAAKCDIFLRYGLSLFNVPQDTIDTNLKQATQLANTKTLTIQGFRI
jgi:AcrR family transcriptional regulator